jgi:hypothetical protein
MELGERAGRFRFLIRDRDGKFGRACDEILASAAMRVLKIPPRSPNGSSAHSGANASITCWSTVSGTFDRSWPSTSATTTSTVRIRHCHYANPFTIRPRWSISRLEYSDEAPSAV